jgi:glycosyltransferase involved in cell wall biosynthesis
VKDGARIAVVVPARDEARSVAAVIGSMPPFVDHVVVVDDGSSDDTATRAAAARGPAATWLVRHRQSRGVGAAIAAGYREALALGADVVAVMAGDGQMAPEDLESVVAPVVRGDADYVKGDRLRHPDRRAMPLARRAGTFFLARLTSAAIGVEVHDSQCGYTAISRAALGRLDLAALWPRYGYPNDLLAMLARAGLRIAEVPVRPVYAGEASGLRPWHLGRIGWLIARAWWRR